MNKAHASNCHMLKIAVYWEKTCTSHTTLCILHNLYYLPINESNYLSIYLSMYCQFIYPRLQLTPRITADLQNIKFPQLINASLTCYGTPRFITLFNKYPLLVPTLSRMNPAHEFPQDFFHTSFIICMYTQLTLSFRYSYQDTSTYFLAFENAPHALPISFFLLLLSTIFCNRQFRDSCVYFDDVCCWTLIRNSVTCD